MKTMRSNTILPRERTPPEEIKKGGEVLYGQDACDKNVDMEVTIGHFGDDLSQKG